MKALLCIGCLLAAGGQQSPRHHLDAPALTAETRVTSPAVVTTIVKQGGQLALLVLWRGAPEWFTGTGGGGASTEQGAGIITTEARYGQRIVGLTFDSKTRVARLVQQDVLLEPAVNVILVDGVDLEPRRAEIRLLSIPAELPPSADAVPVLLRRSKKILAFLRCDVRVADENRQRTFDRLCASAGAGRH